MQKADPTLVCPDCYGHQVFFSFFDRGSTYLLKVNLIVGDYFKCTVSVLIPYTTKANELIAWLQSKTQVLGLMQDIQTTMNATNHTTRVISVIHAILTCWTAHYLAYKCLLDLKWVLEATIWQDSIRIPADQIIVSGNAKAKQKAQEMVAIMGDLTFWKAIATFVIHLLFSFQVSRPALYWIRVKKHLEPLTLVACMTRTVHCHLDQVLLVFGLLHCEYTKMLSEPETSDHPTPLKAILNSIEKHWAECDQDVFIAALVFNPLFKLNPFAKISKFNNAGVFDLLSQLWV
jgi:hypothetical protein